MKKLLNTTALSIALLGMPLSGFSKDVPVKESSKEAEVNKTCPITGKAVFPACTTEYEGKTYAFCSGACRTKFKEARAASLYQKIGGKAAINAAVDLFYKKVLADKTVSHFFEDINMERQHRKQKAFLSAALGGPEPWTGKNMRKAHRGLDLEEAHFNAIAGHLKKTLEELKVKKELVDEVIGVVASVKDDVLNKKKPKE